MANLTTPIGRIVQGNPLVENIQYDDKQQPKINKQGAVVKSWYLNVAFDKANPETLAMIEALYRQAATDYPGLFPYGYQPQANPGNPAAGQPPIHAGGCIRSDFAYKIKDGDGFDANGKPHAAKEGWKGCYILQIATYAGQPRVVCALNNNSPVTEVGSGSHAHIKCGDYVRVGIDVKSNGWQGDAQSKPGMYVNPTVIQVVGYGDLIQGGPDPDAVFAQQTAYIPQGMQTAPTAGAPMPGSLPPPMAAPGQLGQMPPVQQAAPQQLPPPVQQAAPQQLPPPIQAAPQTPQALPVLPNHQVVQAVVAQVPQYVITPAAAAQGHTVDSLRAQGYADDVLLANGFIQLAG